MSKQTPGRIYLADQRGLTETAQFRRYSTFNFGSYAHEHKKALGSLLAVNEEMVAGLQHITLRAQQTSHVVIVPITGAIEVKDSFGTTYIADVGEVQVITLPVASTLVLTNPYEADVVSFLHLWIKAEESIMPAFNYSFHFDLDLVDNKLANLVPGSEANSSKSLLPFSLHLGRFAGRHETVYQASDAGSLLFTFVVAGAFEVEGRLLHEKDGLGLWETTGIELEALSNNALVVVLEVNSNGQKLA
ncbi:hypothetical protein [Hymenobacter sp. GOD-10R]|uniref:pirin family protein n=1 Tax=Hymenobacter sp. GOD-10R TaxID=3093922 RepID=UPI002D787B5C|nr:hypothetical protein [Hymenobacter sp. GOD-10R]WRQ29269.1 hypothetical protein SD425_03195 [Hymenobacter sp. GOD-10R]